MSETSNSSDAEDSSGVEIDLDSPLTLLLEHVEACLDGGEGECVDVNDDFAREAVDTLLDKGPLGFIAKYLLPIKALAEQGSNESSNEPSASSEASKEASTSEEASGEASEEASKDASENASASSNVMPYAKLLAALGFHLPVSVVADPKFSPHDYEIALQVAMRYVLRHRSRLPTPRTLVEVLDCIKRASRVLVITGAGISTSLGIPDFRSETGLYAQLKHLGLSDPQEVFDIHLFREDPSIFYSVAPKLLPLQGLHSGTPTHKFIKLLHEHGKLLRNYTQNIDNLERFVGIPDERVVQCHGSIGSFHCITCGFKVENGEVLFPQIEAREIPRCPECLARNMQSNKRPAREDLRKAEIKRDEVKQEEVKQEEKQDVKQEVKQEEKQDVKQEVKQEEKQETKQEEPIKTEDTEEKKDEFVKTKRERPSWEEEDAQDSNGVLKPDITFFGESLPDRFDRMLFDEGDARKCDLVICMGTSLRVSPVSEIVKVVPRDVPQIYISNSKPPTTFEATFLGQCDDVVELLCAQLEWHLEHPMERRPKDMPPTQFPGGEITYDDGVFTFTANK